MVVTGSICLVWSRIQIEQASLIANYFLHFYLFELFLYIQGICR